jgi:hypothetical protein
MQQQQQQQQTQEQQKQHQWQQQKKKAPTKQQQKLQQTTTASAAKLGIFINMSSTSPTAACYTHSSSYEGFLTYLLIYLPTYLYNYLPIGFLLLALPGVCVSKG